MVATDRVHSVEIVDELCPECRAVRLIRVTPPQARPYVECGAGCNVYIEDEDWTPRVHTVVDCETCEDTGMVLQCLCGCGHTRIEEMCPMRNVECYECGGRWPNRIRKSW